MKLDYYSIENLEINQNSFFYNIMKDLSEEEKEEQRYFELFSYEKFTTYTREQNFFIRIQYYVDKFVKKVQVKTLRKLFKFIEVIQKYCLNIDKVKDIIQNLRPIAFTKNTQQILLINEICQQNFNGKISFRFLKEFISPLNIIFFLREIVNIGRKNNDYKCLHPFSQQFGEVFDQTPNVYDYGWNNKTDYSFYMMDFHFLYFPSKEEPLVLIQTDLENEFQSEDMVYYLHFFQRMINYKDIQTLNLQQLSQQVVGKKNKKVYQITIKNIQKRLQEAERNYEVRKCDKPIKYDKEFVEKQKEEIEKQQQQNCVLLVEQFKLINSLIWNL